MRAYRAHKRRLSARVVVVRARVLERELRRQSVSTRASRRGSSVPLLERVLTDHATDQSHRTAWAVKFSLVHHAESGRGRRRRVHLGRSPTKRSTQHIRSAWVAHRHARPLHAVLCWPAMNLSHKMCNNNRVEWARHRIPPSGSNTNVLPPPLLLQRGREGGCWLSCVASPHHHSHTVTHPTRHI